jgi:hypothetical protein
MEPAPVGGGFHHVLASTTRKGFGSPPELLVLGVVDVVRPLVSYAGVPRLVHATAMP